MRGWRETGLTKNEPPPPAVLTDGHTPLDFTGVAKVRCKVTRVATTHTVVFDGGVDATPDARVPMPVPTEEVGKYVVEYELTYGDGKVMCLEPSQVAVVDSRI